MACRAPVNRIIPFSLVDGPGARCSVFLQGCNIACTYCHNPETQRLCVGCGVCKETCPFGVCLQADDTDYASKCIACGICIDACPAGCLALSERPRNKGVDSFPYLKNPKACIGCGFCSTECPVDSIIMVKPEKTTVQES